MLSIFFFFFQAEDGIRDRDVTGVQTCALPIFCSATPLAPAVAASHRPILLSGFPSGELQELSHLLDLALRVELEDEHEIGRASCRKGVDLGGRRIIKKKNEK